MREFIYKKDCRRLNRRNMWFRNEKRKEMCFKYLMKRYMLKKAGLYDELDKLPKNSSPIRVRNLCQCTGRSRGYMRRFGLCRYKFRELAISGELPGVMKASW